MVHLQSISLQLLEWSSIRLLSPPPIQSNSCCDITLKPCGGVRGKIRGSDVEILKWISEKNYILVALEKKFRGSPKSVGFILRAPVYHQSGRANERLTGSVIPPKNQQQGYKDVCCHCGPTQKIRPQKTLYKPAEVKF